MSSSADKPSSRRRHDAAASRRALLDAAATLFHARGYDAATVREIGDRAGVDPALIARYFGGKEGLYLAALDRDDAPALPAEPLEAVARMLAFNDARGSGPVLRAMVSPTLSNAARHRLRRVIARRLTGPLTAVLEERGVPDAALRAELTIAIVVGLALTRAGGVLPALRRAGLGDVVAILEPVVDALTEVHSATYVD